MASQAVRPPPEALATRIGAGTRVGPDVWIEDSTVGADCLVWFSVLRGAVLGDGVGIVDEGTRGGAVAHSRLGRSGSGHEHGVTVGDGAAIGGGVIEIRSPELPVGSIAEVIVIVDEAAASKLQKSDYYHWVYQNKPQWQRIQM